MHFDWATIYKHLQELETEGYVQISQADNIQFSITEAGIAKAGLPELMKERVSR